VAINDALPLKAECHLWADCQETGISSHAQRL